MALLVALAGCRASGPIDQEPPWELHPYDALPAPDLETLADARECLARGELERAERVLRELVRLYPRNVPVAALLQEIDLARLDGYEPGVRAAGIERMRRMARGRAEREDTAVAHVLAARLEGDRRAAAVLLDRAADLDPRCVWAPYGRAHALARDGEDDAARLELERALQIDPEHLSARRLETQLLVRAGASSAAALALEGWLEVAAGDPRVAPRVVCAARLDLAVVELLMGRAQTAIEVLDESRPQDASQRARLLCLRAAATLESGDFDLALTQVRAAAEADPQAPLPQLQLALLLEDSGEPDRARAAWTEVIALLEARAGTESGREQELSSLLKRIEAQVHLERLEADLEAESEPVGNP